MNDALSYINPALISIKPQYADLIFSGKKQYEFRKKVPQVCKWPSRFYVYSSSPVKKIVGWFRTHGYGHYTNFDALWRYTGDRAGISREDLERYFANAKEMFAITIGTFHSISPIELREIGIKYAPQNFAYLTEKQAQELFWEH